MPLTPKEQERAEELRTQGGRNAEEDRELKALEAKAADTDTSGEPGEQPMESAETTSKKRRSK